MIEFKTLASGSKGNCSLVMNDNVKILIDVGMNYLYIKDQLEKINLEPADIDFILITHTHSDHIKGLKQFINKTKKKIYVPEKMTHEFKDMIDDQYIEILDDVTEFLDLKIELMYTSHDTDCSVGFVISSDNTSIVYITDTGYINKKYFELLKNKDLYYIESNHDETMLMDGPYPYYLKQRIISDYGHLSNKATAKYLKEFVGNRTKYIILGHLSEHNNTEELALMTTVDKLKKIDYNGEILIARQNDATDLIEV